jgi:hypothetical protein
MLRACIGRLSCTGAEERRWGASGGGEPVTNRLRLALGWDIERLNRATGTGVQPCAHVPATLKRSALIQSDPSLASC